MAHLRGGLELASKNRLAKSGKPGERPHADVTQLAEYLLPRQDVARSNRVVRSPEVRDTEWFPCGIKITGAISLAGYRQRADHVNLECGARYPFFARRVRKGKPGALRL